MKKFEFNEDYMMKQSEECLEKSKKFENNGEVDLAIFYKNASEGYKIKVDKIKKNV